MSGRIFAACAFAACLALAPLDGGCAHAPVQYQISAPTYVDGSFWVTVSRTEPPGQSRMFLVQCSRATAELNEPQCIWHLLRERAPMMTPPSSAAAPPTPSATATATEPGPIESCVAPSRWPVVVRARVDGDGFLREPQVLSAFEGGEGTCLLQAFATYVVEDWVPRGTTAELRFPRIAPPAP